MGLAINVLVRDVPKQVENLTTASVCLDILCRGSCLSRNHQLWPRSGLYHTRLSGRLRVARRKRCAIWESPVTESVFYSPGWRFPRICDDNTKGSPLTLSEIYWLPIGILELGPDSIYRADPRPLIVSGVRNSNFKCSLALFNTGVERSLRIGVHLLQRCSQCVLVIPQGLVQSVRIVGETGIYGGFGLSDAIGDRRLYFADLPILVEDLLHKKRNVEERHKTYDSGKNNVQLVRYRALFPSLANIHWAVPTIIGLAGMAVGSLYLVLVLCFADQKLWQHVAAALLILIVAAAAKLIFTSAVHVLGFSSRRYSEALSTRKDSHFIVQPVYAVVYALRKFVDPVSILPPS